MPSPSTITTLQVDTSYENAHRFPAWMALAVFSAVCLAATTAHDSVKELREADVKWVLSVTAISMILSFGAVVMYLVARSMFVGQVVEAGMISLLLAFWGAGLPVIMNPSNDIAVDNIEVTNANLYFFSWLSLACCLFLSASLLQQAMDVDVRRTSPKAACWYGLCASSLVVMGASVRIYVVNPCDNSDVTNSMFCRRTRVGIGMGVTSFVLAAILTYLSHLGLAVLYETLATTIMLAMWCFGVGYITFGTSPGSRIGNLYFSSWISFILVVVLFGQCFRDMMNARYNTSDDGESEAPQESMGEDPYSPTSTNAPHIPDDDEL